MFALSQTYCVGARRYSVGTMRGTVHTLYQIHCVGARRYSVGTERHCSHVVSNTLCRSSEVQCRYREVHTLSDRGNARTVLQRQASVCMYRGTVCVFDERRFHFERSVFNEVRPEMTLAERMINKMSHSDHLFPVHLGLFSSSLMLSAFLFVQVLWVEPSRWSGLLQKTETTMNVS